MPRKKQPPGRKQRLMSVGNTAQGQSRISGGIGSPRGGSRGSRLDSLNSEEEDQVPTEDRPVEEEGERLRGVVVALEFDRGFGFLLEENGQEEVFFHAKGMESPLRFEDLCLNDVVTFQAVTSVKGPRAIKIRRA